MIRFDEVHIGYHESILKVNLDALECGKAYAIIGENGCGKSTFLKTISGQIKPFSGDLRIDGISLKNNSKLQFSKLVSFVSTQVGLISNIQAVDFISLGRTPYLNALGRLSKTDTEIVESAMDQLNLTHLKRKMLDTLSDGERQLCAIASAICQQTPIILLDEPTSFLDYKNKVTVLELLNSLAKIHQKCVIFSTHDLELVTKQQGNVLYKSNTSKDLNLLVEPFVLSDLIDLAY